MVDEGIVKCKYCSKLIRASSKNETSALKNHLERCKKYPANLDRRQKLIDFDTRTIINEDGSVQTVSVPIQILAYEEHPIQILDH